MEKWTTQKKNKAIKAGEKELESLQKGSEKWTLLYKQIEYVKENL